MKTLLLLPNALQHFCGTASRHWFFLLHRLMTLMLGMSVRPLVTFPALRSSPQVSRDQGSPSRPRRSRTDVHLFVRLLLHDGHTFAGWYNIWGRSRYRWADHHGTSQLGWDIDRLHGQARSLGRHLYLQCIASHLDLPTKRAARLSSLSRLAIGVLAANVNVQMSFVIVMFDSVLMHLSSFFLFILGLVIF